MATDGAGTRVRRVVGVALDAAIEQVATVPRLQAGAAHRLVPGALVAGGRSAATVRAARALGLDAELLAVLGGRGGAWYRDAVSAAGIHAHAVETTAETPRFLSVLDEETGSLTSFEDAPAPLGQEDWPRVEAALAAALEPPAAGTGMDAPPEAPAAGTVVVLAGRLPAGAPPDAYRRLASQAAAAGARVAADLGGDPFGAVLGASPWLVTADLETTGAMLGLEGADDPVAAGRALVRRGAGTAIVTLGTQGAVLVARDWAWRLGPAPADRLGPYAPGAADAFLAGWLAGLARGDDVVIGLRRAGAALVANSRRPGQGELDPADLMAAIATFTVEPVNA